MDSQGTILYRLTQLEDWRREHENWRREVDDDRNDLKYLIEAQKALAITVDGLRKVLIGFAFTIAGSAIVFALSVLIATGKIGHG